MVLLLMKLHLYLRRAGFSYFVVLYTYLYVNRWLVPGPGAAAAALKLHNYSTIGIFVISGLLLQRGEALTALRSPLALAFGILSTLFLTPLAAFAILNIPSSLLHPEMALGLAVFCCVPTTLSTCVTLTLACRGNAATALLLVIATNILGVFTLPPVLSIVLGASTSAMAFDPVVLFFNLVKTVLLPLLGGVFLQVAIPRVGIWRTQNRKLLSYLSTLFLCTVPWMQLSVASSSLLPITWQAISAATAAGAVLHLVFLTFNSAMASAVPFNSDPGEDVAVRKAVILCTSEKTLPVAVAVVSQLSSIMGAAAGFATIACVLAHLVQIIIDSAVVSRWNRAEALQKA